MSFDFCNLGSRLVLANNALVTFAGLLPILDIHIQQVLRTVNFCKLPKDSKGQLIKNDLVVNIKPTEEKSTKIEVFNVKVSDYPY